MFQILFRTKIIIIDIFLKKKIVINDNKYKVIDADLNEYIPEI